MRKEKVPLGGPLKEKLVALATGSAVSRQPLAASLFRECLCCREPLWSQECKSGHLHGWTVLAPGLP